MYDLNSLIANILSIFSRLSLNDFLDVCIVAFVFYKIFMFIKDTRAEQLFKGILLLILILQISSIFELHALHWMLVNTLEFGVIASIVVFQPELRTGLERIGRTKISFIPKSNNDISQELINDNINEIVEALYSLSRQKIGALIVIERETKLNDIINTGTIMNSDISRQLLINIFIPNTPLHDGAVVIKDFKIASSGCFLPLTQRKDLNKDLGTRHRAGIGISETTDSLTLIVSEETGNVSLAKSGKLYKDVPKERMVIILRNNLKVSSNDKGFFKGGIFN